MTRMSDDEFDQVLMNAPADRAAAMKLAFEARRVRESEKAALDALDKLEVAFWRVVNGGKANSDEYAPAVKLLQQAGRR